MSTAQHINGLMVEEQKLCSNLTCFIELKNRAKIFMSIMDSCLDHCLSELTKKARHLPATHKNTCKTKTYYIVLVTLYFYIFVGKV